MFRECFFKTNDFFFLNTTFSGEIKNKYWGSLLNEKFHIWYKFEVNINVHIAILVSSA